MERYRSWQWDGRALLRGPRWKDWPGPNRRCRSELPQEANFDAWLDGERREAAAAGISQKAIDAGLGVVRFDPGVVKKDRAQGVFSQTFLEFSDRMVEHYRVKQGPGCIKKYADRFARIEKEFGVPAPVIVAFWALETDFGANIGDDPTLDSLATLAYDCRRPDLFRPQLLDALNIIDRGDLTVAKCAGLGGRTRPVPVPAAHYLDYGVDYDGDGKVNLLKSTAGCARLGREPPRPARLEARPAVARGGEGPGRISLGAGRRPIKLPRSEWVAAGVKGVGRRCRRTARRVAAPADGAERTGVPRLPELHVFLEWNSSLVYSTTAAYLATRLDGAPNVSAAAIVTLASPRSSNSRRSCQEGLQRRQDRRHHRRADPRGGQGRAAQARPAGRLLSDEGTAGEAELRGGGDLSRLWHQGAANGVRVVLQHAEQNLRRRVRATATLLIGFHSSCGDTEPTLELFGGRRQAAPNGLDARHRQSVVGDFVFFEFDLSSKARGEF